MSPVNPFSSSGPFTIITQPVKDSGRQQPQSAARRPPPMAQTGTKRAYPSSPLATSSTSTLLSPKSPASSSVSPPTPPRTASSSNSAAHAAFLKGPSLQTTSSNSSLNDSRYISIPSAGRTTTTLAPSLSAKYSLSPDPLSWGTDLNHPEPDDYLHNPDPRRDRRNDSGGNIFTCRGLSNLGFLVLLGAGLVVLFAGYPLITYFTRHPLSTFGGFNLGGINGSGQVPAMHGNWGLIDVETPHSAYTKAGYYDGQTYHLVFSDEFNTDGRTFYPGDDPYWEAFDLNYWATKNLEWYDPSAVTTKGGSLQITFSATPSHDLNYMGGSISTWNKFCFTGGLIESSVSLPGVSNVAGFWPAIWTMGNLGRAGYGASVEGLWPYTYDSCDVGTVQNQTVNGLPLAATVNGDLAVDGVLSFLPGQRLSRCTCQGESHPGPVHADGTYVGRSAPEIDIFEAQVQKKIGAVSQSAQFGPFNAGYRWFNTTNNVIINNPDITSMNVYLGSAFQQAASGVTITNPQAYELGGGLYETYGFEYKPGFDNAYITWMANGQPAWTIKSGGLAADTRVEIGSRPVPQEPMYIIVNLGMSPGFGDIDFAHLTFPATMKVDWIRVYQLENAKNIGCDPKNFPTAAYINQYIEAYTNPNLTTWRDDYHQPWPKNRFLGQC